MSSNYNLYPVLSLAETLALGWVTTPLIEAVFGKTEFINYIPKSKDNTVVISIRNPDDDSELLETYSKYSETLVTRFWDVVEPQNDRGTIIETISEKEGLEISEFIFKNRDKTFVIHCEAGVSRSAGVALAVHGIIDHLGNKYSAAISPSEIKNHPRYHPNLTVYDAVMDSFDTSGLLILSCTKCNFQGLLTSFTPTRMDSGTSHGLMCPYCFHTQKA